MKPPLLMGFDGIGTLYFCKAFFRNAEQEMTRKNAVSHANGEMPKVMSKYSLPLYTKASASRGTVAKAKAPVAAKEACSPRSARVAGVGKKAGLLTRRAAPASMQIVVKGAARAIDNKRLPVHTTVHNCKAC